MSRQPGSGSRNAAGPIARVIRGLTVDFWQIAKLLVRRWMITLPLLVVTGLAGVVPLSQVKPSYVAVVYVQLVPPVVTQADPARPTADQRNPWLGLGPQALGDAVIVSVTEQYVVKQLKKAGYSDEFKLTLSERTPMVTFEITGTSRQQAIGTANQLVTRFTQSTAELQTAYRVAKDDTISAHRLGHGVNVTASNSKLKRAGAAAGAAALLVTVGGTVAIDSWLRRRRIRREQRASRGQPARPADTEPVP